MLQYFDGFVECKIVLQESVTSVDIELLQELFLKQYMRYEIIFSLLYSVPKELVILLDKEIQCNKKNISLITNHARLQKYLSKLGLSSKLNSLLEEISAQKQNNLYTYLEEYEEFVAYTRKCNDEKKQLKFLLQKVQKRYGYNFLEYNFEMMQRRLEIFISRNRLLTLSDAAYFILTNPHSFQDFFLEVSINVTEFFRDTTLYKYLHTIFTKEYYKKSNIKIWSAGCSSGEEPYSLAILLECAQELDKSLIYATDFNHLVLKDAKNALYSNDHYNTLQNKFNELETECCIDSYITKYSQFFQINNIITQKVLFLEHNLATDGSFNEFDIIMCRNVIIYFSQELQAKVIQLLYDSLRFGGYLVLGSHETMNLSFQNRFERVNDSAIYKKVA